MKLISSPAVAALLLSAPAAVFAAEAVVRPEPFRKLLDCRSVAEASARLACYDRQAAEMALAADRRELMVVDRTEMRKARRSLFGLSLPSLPLFGGGDGFTEIESTIQSARFANHRWHVTLEDGAHWVQVDTRAPSRDPRAGQKIRIRRAALGSFLANIDGQTAMRMRREN